MIARSVLLTACAIGVLAACSPAEPEEQAPPRAARIEAVEAAATSNQREFVGRVEARLTVDLSFQVGGRLAEFPVSEGELIQQGAMVARLETQDFERARREAQVQLQQARQNLDRQSTLNERGIASDAALEDAQTAYDLRAVALDNARQNLEYATISAPFDGLISRRLVDNYTTVSPGQPVVRIQDISELRVAIQVPESLIAQVDREDKPDMIARFPFLPDQSFTLEYRELVAEPDQASQTYTALFALPDNLPANILPGMTASVTVNLPQTVSANQQGVVAPLSALSSNPDGSFSVWIYDGTTGAVSRRDVLAGPIEGGQVVIHSGLEPGEEIVTAGVTALHEGMLVRPINSSNR
ncbi:MAG: efflux transporter periplasmic adaptor subunit [Oceanicaulis sp.]|jgi:RND family efflux transporter MFP subunit|uniref:efflux RND transporter periplasmic adaptor subunit n=1 Tax=unclassified Oceanicaulis TaxID=2632123 RepID=UPI000C4E09CD|nr:MULTISPECIES: efflux RND transporter periplasmic adaptor subunit [unclassified Oceanicaulis]MAB70750.1 efflux transporter periplasmic adaptor subunit [Oceanicaulis sp.]MBC37872.1 efflux transporter periplasmic adaptor subunit [Oceanicaulis sp.]MBG34629.1 efflux transporter periplasmic adaptor subunit [Oceanicaulis sp.]HBU61255.1 efflux RND transporter periplasmic adaptor subunit [Oceanicaulis sp.]HCR94592.1 efflux RND transporter periplasmic adaptor subunit [Oceanicaulis sp.]